MYKSHGKEYIENNFSPAELAALMKSSPSPPSPPAAAAAILVGMKNASVASQQPAAAVALSKQPLPPLDFGCKMCGSKFLTRGKLMVHMQSHGIILVPCSACGDKFVSQLELSSHMSTMHGKKFPLSGLAVKKRRPGPASKTNAPPEKRGASSLPNYLQLTQVSRRSSLASNVEEKSKLPELADPMAEIIAKLASAAASKAVRPDEKPSCNFCTVVCSSQMELSHHLINEHFKGLIGGGGGKSSGGVKCQSCPRSFASQDQLESHVKSVHRAKHIRRTLGLEPERLPAHFRLKPGPKRAKLQMMAQIDPNYYLKDSEGTLSYKAARLPLPSSAVISASKISKVLSPNCRPVVLCSQSCVSVVPPVTSSVSVSLPTVSTVISMAKPAVLKPPSHVVNMMLNSLTPTGGSPCNTPPANLNNNNEEENNNNISNGGTLMLNMNNLMTRKKSECPVCGIVLSPKTNVNVHLRTHSGVRPYECVLCLNRFRQKAHLMKHFRCTHNQKQPPHICLFCNLETVTSNDLYRHITDAHQKETDELRPSLLAARSDAAAAAKEAQQKAKMEEEEQKKQDLLNQQELEEVENEAAMDDDQPEQLSDDLRYEPITEDFLFEDNIISPCYVVLPYVTQEEVEAACDEPIEVSSLITMSFHSIHVHGLPKKRNPVHSTQ